MDNYIEFIRHTKDEDLEYSNKVKEIRHRIQPEGATVEDMMQAFKSFLLACGYHKDCINEYIEDI